MCGMLRLVYVQYMVSDCWLERLCLGLCLVSLLIVNKYVKSVGYFDTQAITNCNP